MAAACPHCGHPTISAFRRLCAIDWLPTTCFRCGGRSYVGFSIWRAIVAFLLSLVGAILFAASDPNVPILSWLGGTILVVAPLWYILRSPLRPISNSQVRVARWLTGGFVSLLVVGSAVAIIAAQRHVP